MVATKTGPTPDTAPHSEGAVPVADSETPAKIAPLTGKAALFARPLKTTLVDWLPDGMEPQLVREITGGELGEINHLAVKREGEKVITDYRNYKERVLAHALLNPDGSQMFLNPMLQYTELLVLPQRVTEILYAAVDEMSAITKKRQAEVGKASRATTGTAGLSN
jgi:hypothetical protein